MLDASQTIKDGPLGAGIDSHLEHDIPSPSALFKNDKLTGDPADVDGRKTETPAGDARRILR